MTKIQTICLIMLLGVLDNINAQSTSSTYSFFIAGHTYGQPGVNNVGLHPPFKAKFDYIRSRDEIKFGVLTGDIVSPGPIAQDWDEVDADIDSLGIPVYFAVGNHDMENRPLFESRYGSTYYSFLYENDLFIILDPNIDGWSILGDQLVFLENTVESNYQSVDNIFVLFHQLLWWENENIYGPFKPNSTAGIIRPTNFWTVIEPLFHELPNNVVFCGGDMGAAWWSADFVYDNYDNITIVGSGMGEEDGDNFVVLNINDDKTVSYDLICLSDSTLDCFGDITDYQLSPVNENITSSSKLRLYPNPVIDFLTVELNNTNDVLIQISNITGKLILKKHYRGDSKYKIDLSHLPKGVYLLNAVLKSNISITKFIIY